MEADIRLFRALLEGAGIERDSLLVVHSAIGKLSRQGFRANDMIETLLEHVRDGGLFMPTMTWRTVTPDRPNWHELETPSHTGVLTEIFRTQYASDRSIHPTHSVAGSGAAAPLLLSRHHVDDTPVSANSPYGLMKDYRVFVLMIGIGLEMCTAIHHPEEIINEPLYVLPRETGVVYPCRDRFGTVHQVRARRHRRLNRDFPQFEPRLVEKGLMKVHMISGCRCLTFPLHALMQELFAALIKDPQATLAADARA